MTSRINVCHLATLTAWGGVERMLVDLLIHARQEQVKHALLTTSSDPEVVAPARAAGILWYQPDGLFRFDPAKFVRMARWLRSQKIGVVHSYNARANAWANIATLLAGTPALITGEHRATWSASPTLAWLDHWAHRRARLVVANSKASARVLSLKQGVASSKIRVVYNGIADIPPITSSEARKGLGIAEDILVVGSVGRLDTPKDFATLIESAAIVIKARKDVVFVLVGGGPLEAELRALVSELQIQDRFLMTGQRADARNLLQGFDVFVSTSIRESFGNALIEASLCAKPVIAPAIDGIPEAVSHEESGLVLDPAVRVRQYRSPNATPLPKRVLIDGKLQPPKALDPRQLAETILNLLADKELRQRYGQQGRDRAQRLFSLGRYIDDLEQLYLELDEGRGNELHSL